jgi:hypothetical protein
VELLTFERDIMPVFSYYLFFFTRTYILEASLWLQILISFVLSVGAFTMFRHDQVMGRLKCMFSSLNWEVKLRTQTLNHCVQGTESVPYSIQREEA